MTRFLPVAVAGLLAGFVLSGFDPGVGQPLRYNHRKHAVELGLPCTTCHGGAEEGVEATLPRAEVCLTCHGSPQGSSREEAKVRLLTQGGREIAWRRLTLLRPDVYFSHRRHVALGKVACETCHGKMAERTSPPRHALVSLQMDDCLKCHRSRGASTDCNACHR